MPPSEDLEKFRILESRKNYESADEWLRNFPEATWDEVRTFITFYCAPDEDMMTALLKDTRTWEARKLKPSEVNDAPAGSLEDELRVSMAKFRGSLDYLSLVGSTVRPTGYTESLLWNDLNPEIFLRPFTEDKVSGGFLTVTGRPRMGKTGVACDVAEFWLDKWPGTEVLSNVPLEDAPPPGVRPISTVPGLMRGISEALVAERRWLWVFDEPALSGWLKADAPTAKAKNLERFARIVPKLSGSFIYIEQRVEGVPTVIQDFSQSHIFCTSPGSVFISLPRKRMPLRHVPKPKKIKYRTGEAGMFDIAKDFPWDKFFKALRYDPEALTIEAAELPTQGERIATFLNDLEGITLDSIQCRFCRASWIPKVPYPARCPKCNRRKPVLRPGEVVNEEPEAVPATS